MKVLVIIPAAGLGTRMAPPREVDKTRSKQFVELNGTPILIHTLRKFWSGSLISEVWVALRRGEISRFRALLADGKSNPGARPVQLVEGGETRQESVAKALAAIKAEETDIVLVHDAVRPFITQQIITDVIDAATKYGAAIAALPAIDTVKQVDRTAEGAIVTATMPRERLVMAQTPQGFRYDVLKKAFDEAAVDGFVGTDEASLVERSGHDVVVVMGSPKNIKITTFADLELANFYIQSEGTSK